MADEDRYKAFKQYLDSGKPGVEKPAHNWSRTIRLQDLDSLKPPEFMLKQAKHKEPEIMEFKKSEYIFNFANLFVLVGINETFCVLRRRDFCEYDKDRRCRLGLDIWYSFNSPI